MLVGAGVGVAVAVGAGVGVAEGAGVGVEAEQPGPLQIGGDVGAGSGVAAGVCAKTQGPRISIEKKRLNFIPLLLNEPRDWSSFSAKLKTPIVRLGFLKTSAKQCKSYLRRDAVRARRRVSDTATKDQTTHLRSLEAWVFENFPDLSSRHRASQATFGI